MVNWKKSLYGVNSLNVNAKGVAASRPLVTRYVSTRPRRCIIFEADLTARRPNGPISHPVSFDTKHSSAVKAVGIHPLTKIAVHSLETVGRDPMVVHDRNSFDAGRLLVGRVIRVD